MSEGQPGLFTSKTGVGDRGVEKATGILVIPLISNLCHAAR